MAVVDDIIRTLMDITGNPFLYTHADGVRGLLICVVIGMVAYQNDRQTLSYAYKGLVLSGGALLAYDLLHADIFVIGVATALNISLAGILGVLAYKKRLLSDLELKFLLAITVFIPTYPFLGVFPLHRIPLTAPLNLFSITLLTNLAGVLLVYTGYRVLRSHTEDIPPLAAAFGRRVPVTEFHQHHGWLMYDADGDFMMDGITGGSVQEYLEWRNTTDGVSDADSIADVDDPCLVEYLEATGLEDVSAEDVQDDAEFMDWLSGQDSVWVTDGPSFPRLLGVALLVSLVVGDLLLYFLL